MRPKDLWVRGRWTILETEQIGSACVVGLVMALVFLVSYHVGRALIMAGVTEKTVAPGVGFSSERGKLHALSW